MMSLCVYVMVEDFCRVNRNLFLFSLTQLIWMAQGISIVVFGYAWTRPFFLGILLVMPRLMHTVGRQSNSYNKTSTWFGSQSVVMRCICKTLNINLCLTIRAHSFNSIRSLDKSDDFLSYKSSELWMVHTFISIDGDTMFAVRINSTQNSSCVVLANESMLE